MVNLGEQKALQPQINNLSTFTQNQQKINIHKILPTPFFPTSIHFQDTTGPLKVLQTLIFQIGSVKISKINLNLEKPHHLPSTKNRPFSHKNFFRTPKVSDFFGPSNFRTPLYEN